MKRFIRTLRAESQRTDGFKGGIPQGVSTFDIPTKKLDELTKLVAAHLATDPDILAAGLNYTKHFSQLELGGEGAKQWAAPDGGLWRDKNDRILFMIEAKKQDKMGNAFERWYANREYFNYNKGVRSLTLLAGEGCKPNTTMHRECTGVLLREGKPATSFNVTHLSGASFYTFENGLSYRGVLYVMKEWLLGRNATYVDLGVNA
jgi:hypothetical protein